MPQCFVTNVDILIVLSNSDTCNVAVLPVKKLHTHTHTCRRLSSTDSLQKVEEIEFQRLRVDLVIICLFKAVFVDSVF